LSVETRPARPYDGPGATRTRFFCCGERGQGCWWFVDFCGCVRGARCAPPPAQSVMRHNTPQYHHNHPNHTQQNTSGPRAAADRLPLRFHPAGRRPRPHPAPRARRLCGRPSSTAITAAQAAACCT
jgi:hypothetical protein